MRWIFRTNFRSFYLLNATQFLGALNDNIFKFIVIFLLINVQGKEHANTILSLAGAIFVIPFLIFSSGAGVLADRLSKRNIIVFTKVLEVVIMAFAAIIVLIKWDSGLYVALFLMATQSAIFGPSKYGIIPELVEPKMISKANGSITSLTYLAIILGTLLASVLTDISNKNFFLITLFCNFIALIGLMTSLGIGRTEPGKSTKKINPVFLYEIYQTLRFSWRIPNLIPCIFGTSFFLFFGAFAQLNMIPFAMQSLNLSEVGGGYLFLVAMIGIAIGAILAGKLSKDSVEPGLSCIAGFFIVILLISLSVFSHSLFAVLIILTLLGVAGGTYAVPFDAYLQINSPRQKRGQIIAAANFFSFVGVLMASIYLYIVSEELGFSAASGFGILGGISLIANIFVTGRLSFLFFPFIAKKILKLFRRIKLLSPLPDPSKIIVLQGKSWFDPLLLYAHIPNLMIFSPGKFFVNFPWINGLFASIRQLPKELDSEEIEAFIKLIKKFREKHRSICIYFKQEKGAAFPSSYQNLLQQIHAPYIHAQIYKEKRSNKVLGLYLSEKDVNLIQNKKPPLF